MSGDWLGPFFHSPSDFSIPDPVWSPRCFDYGPSSFANDPAHCSALWESEPLEHHSLCQRDRSWWVGCGPRSGCFAALACSCCAWGAWEHHYCSTNSCCFNTVSFSGNACFWAVWILHGSATAFLHRPDPQQVVTSDASSPPHRTNQSTYSCWSDWPDCGFKEAKSCLYYSPSLSYFYPAHWALIASSDASFLENASRRWCFYGRPFCLFDLRWRCSCWRLALQAANECHCWLAFWDQARLLLLFRSRGGPLNWCHH